SRRGLPFRSRRPSTLSPGGCWIHRAARRSSFPDRRSLRSLPAGFLPVGSPIPEAAAPSCEYRLPSELKHNLAVTQVFLVDRNIHDERAVSKADISRQLFCHPLITSDQVGTEGLVILERYEPVGTDRRTRFVARRRQLPMPDRVRGLHRQL